MCNIVSLTHTYCNRNCPDRRFVGIVISSCPGPNDPSHAMKDLATFPAPTPRCASCVRDHVAALSAHFDTKIAEHLTAIRWIETSTGRPYPGGPTYDFDPLAEYGGAYHPASEHAHTLCFIRCQRENALERALREQLVDAFWFERERFGLYDGQVKGELVRRLRWRLGRVDAGGAGVDEGRKREGRDGRTHPVWKDDVGCRGA